MVVGGGGVYLLMGIPAEQHKKTIMKTMKFRAWDKKSKKIRKVRAIIYDHDNEISLLTLIGFDIIHQQDVHIKREPKEVELLKFSCFTDKDKKEIYFNDILEDGEGNKYHVKNHNLAPSLIFKGLNGGDSNYHPIQISMHGYKIIGNIYENPELLTN